MPFTFSHPAIVLPINKKFSRYVDLTGLVLGSMAPDFEYFLRFKPLGTIGHNLVGFIFLNLPLCFILAYIYHYIIKDIFILCLPRPLDNWYEYLRQSKSPWILKNLKSIFIFIYSSLLGMLTHVLWDAFTHESGFFVTIFPPLQKKLLILNYKIPVFKLFQHGSTLIGLIIIVACLYFLRDKNAIRIKGFSNKVKWAYYLSILLCGLFMIFNRMHILKGNELRFLGVYIVTFINGCLVGVVIVSLILKSIIYNDKLGEKKTAHKK